MAHPLLKLLVSAFILSMGFVWTWLYLRKLTPARASAPSLGGARPRRRLGAAICFVLSIMFVLGAHLVDVPDHPRVYAAYWVVMLVLLLWLCMLALKDVRYTRRVLNNRRAIRTPHNHLSALTTSPSEDDRQ